MSGNDLDNDFEGEPSGRPNKSQQKRDIAERMELIEKMTGLADKELARLGVGQDVIDEIAKVRAIKPSGARQRQLKYCVKQLREHDLSQVDLYLNDRRSQQVAHNQAFHHLERWRDRLIDEGDGAIGALLDEWPTLERQQLRQLVRDARREREQGKPAGAGRKLFRYLRGLADAESND
jgi:ribosome-associated protein